MVPRRALFLALLALPAACAHPPRWVRHTRGLRWMYRPATTPYLDDPRFSFEMPRAWPAPEELPNGLRFAGPGQRAVIDFILLEKGKPGWMKADAFRQFMREQGSVSDTHILYRLEVSSRAADAARFTTYRYSPDRLLGAEKEIYTTEMVMIPDLEDLYVVRYETRRAEFERHRRALQVFLDSLVIAYRKPEAPE